MTIEHGWYSSARPLPSPNRDARPPGQPISLLVIHNISLPPGSYGGGHVAELFTNRLDRAAHPYFETIADMRVSTHLYIDREGDVTQFVPFTERAWHAGVSCFEGRERCNDFSIGVEMEGTDTDRYTDAQYRALVDASVAIAAAYPGITLDRIVGHADIAPGRKTDPGIGFDWYQYVSGLQEVMS